MVVRTGTTLHFFVWVIVATYYTDVSPGIMSMWWCLNLMRRGERTNQTPLTANLELGHAQSSFALVCKKKREVLLTNWGFSHDVTKIQTTKLLILLRFYFNDV